MEQEKEPYLPDPLGSKDTRTFPNAHSEFLNVTIKVKEEEEEQEQEWVPNHQVTEESKIFHSGFPDGKVKVKKEEEPQLITQLVQGETSWVQEQKFLDKNKVPDHKGGLPGVKVKLEDESWVCNHDNSKKSDPAQAFRSESPVVPVKVEEEEEPWKPDYQGYGEGFPGMVIKVEPKEESLFSNPQASEESASVSGVQSEETGIPTVPATPLSCGGLLCRPRNPLWSEEELRAFIDIWREEAVQMALTKTYQNVKQFRYISEKLKGMGYQRDLETCRSKAKELQRNYKKVKEGNSHSAHPRTSMPLFDILDQFLCVDNGVVVSHMSGPGSRQQKRCSVAVKDSEKETDSEPVLRLSPLDPNQSSSPQPGISVSDESSHSLLLEPSQQTSSEPETEQQRPQLKSVGRTWHVRNRKKRQRLEFSRELLQGNREMSNQLTETLSRLQDRELAAWKACLERAAASSERALDNMATGLEAVAEHKTQDIRMLVQVVESTRHMMSGFMDRQAAVMEACLSKPGLPPAELEENTRKSHH